MTTTLTRAEKRWCWRTWNLLLQIRQATDGEDRRQLSGEMTERNLLVGMMSPLRAIHRRLWVTCDGGGELYDSDSGCSRILPSWRVTEAGREALNEAVRVGLTIQ